ncbi:AzlC family ABC transporter permease [bacterium]|nr:AzlC family ABC transporter permease [bacterium]
MPVPDSPTARSTFLEGAREIAVLIPGIIPFGMVAGIAALRAGLSPLQAMAGSLCIFAGASQLVAYELIGNAAPVLLVVLAALTVNLRFLLYSTALAPMLSALPLRLRVAAAHIMTDQAYVFGYRRWSQQPQLPHAQAYYFGAALPLLASWLSATLAGVLLGSGVPQEWGLEFAVPLCFIAILVPAVKDRPSLLAAVTGGSIAILLGGLPWKLSLLLGALGGILAGVLASGKTDGKAGGDA